MDDATIKAIEAHGLWLNGDNAGRHADLHGANLHGAKLHGADLSYANLSGANLSYANLHGADLSYANLSYANLHGADLSDADLSYAKLHGANLHGANLHGAKLHGANLPEADLHSLRGCRWGAIGPIGQGRRMVYAIAHDSLPAPVITGGCFQGTFAEFRAKVSDTENLPWNWSSGSPAQVERWRAECLHAADLLELAVAS